MKCYVALLRGINVGGKHKLPMRDLVALLAELGCAQITTYIQSGNLVLWSDQEAEALARRITATIKERHDFAPHVLLIQRAEFIQMARANPFPAGADEPKTLHLGFLESAPGTPDLEEIEKLRTASERFALRGRVFYLHAPEGVGRSKLAARAERLLGVAMTDRNWNTVARLLAMLDQQSGA